MLFLTGFDDDLFMNSRMLDDRTAFLQKPVSAHILDESIGLLLYGTIRRTFSPAKPLPLLTETELLRAPLSTGGTVRVLITGSAITKPDLDEILRALRDLANRSTDG